MECRNSQEKLSAYIDGVILPQDKILIDEHLKSCRECAAALVDLKKTIEHVKNLETVEPPAWLGQKIMAKVRAEAEPEKGLFQKLFYPLHIKLPVGAIATIVIALTTLYIFRTIEPEVKLAKAPSEEAVPKPSQEQQPAQRYTEADKVLPTSPPLTPSVLPLYKGEREEGLSAPKAPEPVKQAESTQRAEAPAPAKKLERMPATGTIAKDEARQETEAIAPGAKLSFMEKKKEEMLTLYVLVKGPEAAIKEIEKTLKELEGKAVRREVAEGKEIITAEIDAGRLKELMEKLRAVGQVKEREADVETMKGELGVRIEIVKNPRSD